MRFLCAALVLVACSGSGGGGGAGSGGASAGSGGSAGMGGEAGQGQAGSGGVCVPDSVELAPACTTDHPTGAAFDPSKSGALPGALAGDFTLPTLSGDLVFSQVWTGCDSFVFLFYPPGTDQGSALLRSSFAALLQKSPPDVHYVFLSYAADADHARFDMAALQSAASVGFSALGQAARAYWEPRLHYVTAPARSTGTWLSTLVNDRAVLAVGVDRFQRIREVGNLSDVASGSSNPEFRFLAYEPLYYDYEWNLERRHAGDGARVVRAFDGMAAHGDVFADVDLGSLDGYDALELDVRLACPGGQDQNCGAWDYLDYLFVCDPTDSTKCDAELGRFITAYNRGGRFSVDVSPLLAMLKGGGMRRMRFASSNANLLTVDLRFRSTCLGVGAPSELIPLWNGGAFDASYNDGHLPMDVPVPADARRVQLYAVVSGHGFGVEKANCAEFCDHEHHFSVGDTTYTLSHPDAGTSDGCMNHVQDGVTPDQYGTWTLGRGGWCPGWKVDPYAVDVTRLASPGSTAHLGYSATVDGKPYVPEPSGVNNGGFGARIDMNSWLVIWR